MLEIGTNENGVVSKRKMEKFDINLCAIPKFLLEQLFVNIRMLQRIVF